MCYSTDIERLRLVAELHGVCNVCNECVTIAHSPYTRYRPRHIYVLAISDAMCVMCVRTFQVTVYVYANKAFSVFKFLLLNLKQSSYTHYTQIALAQ
jgi:hypothetical protein